MKLIKLTLFNNKTPIYINVEMIGSLSDVETLPCSSHAPLHVFPKVYTKP
jgi:hypothetical protein